MRRNAGRPVVIVGAGLTGLSAALHLQDRDAFVLERDERVGGKARSERRDGFTFDVTGHWLHLRDPRVRSLMDDLFGTGDLVEIERRTGIWTHGVMLPYPFQANLHGLPIEVVRECLVGFIEAQRRAASPDAVEPKTFEEFAVARFGEGIARHFFVPYNRKLWGDEYDRLTPDWVSRFVPIPDVEQVVGGAIGIRQEGLGYNARFCYPKNGGIDAVPEAMARRLQTRPDIELKLNASVTQIDPTRRIVRLEGVEEPIEYERLVSTMPLPQLVDAMQAVPAAVAEARSKLRWIGWRWLDVATRSPSPIDEHWVYVPEPDVPFFRVGVYSNALPAMASGGGASLYVELAERSGPVDVDAVLVELARMGAITNPDDVIFAERRDIEYAYVVFDEAYRAATRTIFEWLEHVGVHSCGRYGAWVYNSMEDSIVAGMEAAAWASR